MYVFSLVLPITLSDVPSLGFIPLHILRLSSMHKNVLSHKKKIKSVVSVVSAPSSEFCK